MLDCDSPSPLEGSWQMIRAELNGDGAPELVVQRTVIKFSSGAYRVSFDGNVVDEGTCELTIIDAAPQLTLHGNSGPNSGRIIRAIFQQAGQRLRICFGLDGVLPTTFSTGPGTSRYVATYRLLT
ncbi:MAG: TIGR03067 domain-containing protein [Opitutus sp.]